MTESALAFEVNQLVAQEASFLDTKDWKAWLSLFTVDVEYWVPAWANETELTSDPGNELSLVYIRGRGGLEDRVFRIESGDSFASFPLDRTVHIVSGVLAQLTENSEIEASASWLVHSFGNRGPRTLGGRYEYRLRRAKEGLRIARKRIVLINDAIEGPVDIYHL